jgi:hypothetical protein
VLGSHRPCSAIRSLKKQFEKYGKSAAQTDYLEFEGRPHLLMVAEGLAGDRERDRQLDRRPARLTNGLRPTS